MGIALVLFQRKGVAIVRSNALMVVIDCIEKEGLAAHDSFGRDVHLELLPLIVLRVQLLVVGMA
jgi:hypothetical protein